MRKLRNKGKNETNLLFGHEEDWVSWTVLEEERDGVFEENVDVLFV